jgi:hypothetical protein
MICTWKMATHLLFPHGHQPPLFVVNSHRAQLPFPIRLEVLELGDIYHAKGAPPVLTTPTIPRMKMMIKERLYVQKWVVSWTCIILWTCTDFLIPGHTDARRSPQAHPMDV